MTDHDDSMGPDPEVHGGTSDDRFVWLPAREAAMVYGVTPRTIRKRRDAGKLKGRFVNEMWYIAVPREDIEESGLDLDSLENEYGETDDDFPGGTIVLRDRGSGPGPGNWEPMAELIADLTRKAIEANAAAAMWQERSQQLEIRLTTTTLALESGKVEATEAQRRLEEEKQAEITAARKEAAAEAAREKDDEWRAKSWWQRMRGE